MNITDQYWSAVAEALDMQGWAVLPGLLDAAQCAATIALYDERDRFRSEISFRIALDRFKKNGVEGT